MPSLNTTFSQEDIVMNGHAIELRVYAEDPLNDFLPDIGKLKTYKTPSGEGVRLDDAYIEGETIPIYYDPMIAKLIFYGKDRDSAIEGLKKAITDYHIEGIKTTLDFGTFVLNHEAFKSGKFTTNFVKKHFSSEKLKDAESETFEAAAELMKHLKNEKSKSILINL